MLLKEVNGWSQVFKMKDVNLELLWVKPQSTLNHLSQNKQCF